MSRRVPAAPKMFVGGMIRADVNELGADIRESEPPRAFVKVWHENYEESERHTPSLSWYDERFPGIYHALKEFFLAGHAAGFAGEPLVSVSRGEAGINRNKSDRKRKARA